VRILRLARFAARFTDFTVAPQTNALMRAMVQAGEVDALVPERVWQELARGLMEQQPSRMFRMLRGCDALARILPEFDAAWARDEAAGPGSIARTVDLAAHAGYALPLRFAVLGLGGEGAGGGATAALAEALCARLRVTNECRDLALMSAREQAVAADALNLSAEAIVALLARCDAFRKPERFIDMLNVQECAQRGREQAGAGAAAQQGAWPPTAFLGGALRAAQTVRAGELAALYVHAPERIPEAIHAARVGAVSEFCDAYPPI
jgi:tRNA nucleotidyltransferase (CCA-adding enzyme)